MAAGVAKCPSCGAFMEDWGPKGLRCPWARSATQAAVSINGRTALVCRKPYERKGEGMVVVRG